MTFRFPGGLVDRRRHVRFAAARREPGGAIGSRPPQAEAEKTSKERRCLMGDPQVREPQPIASPGIAGTGVSRVRQRHRIGDRLARLGRSDRRRAHRAAGASGPTIAAISWKCSASGRGLAAAFPAGDAPRFPRPQLSRHDQGVSLSSAPDRLLDARHGHAPGGAGGSARRVAALSARATPCMRALCGPGRF